MKSGTKIINIYDLHLDKHIEVAVEALIYGLKLRPQDVEVLDLNALFKSHLPLLEKN